MSDNHEVTSHHFDVLKGIKTHKIIYPIIIGLCVVGWMLWKEFDPNAFKAIEWNGWVIFGISFAIIMMVMRDFGYMLRIRILTDKKLNWKQAFNVIMLWEFTSAITPSAIGGTSVAVFYVHNENLSYGKSTAIVLATSFLDELYFALAFPILFLFIHPIDLFSIGNHETVKHVLSFSNELFYIAIVGYTIKVLFCALVFYGLFVNPRGLKWLLLSIFKMPILRKWRIQIKKVGDDLVTASQEMKGKGLKFWLKAFGATIVSWTSRYWVVNFLLLAFFFVHEHFLIFARQLIMWIIMLVSPTPGGSGFAEVVFSRYLGDFITIPGLIISLALLWRIITYYPYLIIGAFVFPKWVKSKIKHKETEINQ